MHEVPATSQLTAVTGATGHVGNVLVRELLARGERVRVIVPPGDDLAALYGLTVEVVCADVRDYPALARALKGVGRVYHLAGIVTISSGLRALLEDVNVGGTRNVVRACLAGGVGRLVYTSSVHAIEEPPPGDAIHETRVFLPDRLFGDYAWSKARASIEVMAGVEHGLDAVMVFPSGVVGPHDYRLSELGTLFLAYARGRMHAWVEGAYDFVDVRDVVAGSIAAMERGRRGEGYILAGSRVTVKDMLRILGEVTGVRPPRLRVPGAIARFVARLAPAWYRLTRTRPVFTSYSLRVLASNCAIDCSKARGELGYRPRPFRETVESTIAWLRSTGRLPVPAPRNV